MRFELSSNWICFVKQNVKLVPLSLFSCLLNKKRVIFVPWVLTRLLISCKNFHRTANILIRSCYWHVMTNWKFSFCHPFDWYTLQTVFQQIMLALPVLVCAPVTCQLNLLVTSVLIQPAKFYGTGTTSIFFWHGKSKYCRWCQQLLMRWAPYFRGYRTVNAEANFT